jgi:hypothetical protein
MAIARAALPNQVTDFDFAATPSTIVTADSPGQRLRSRLLFCHDGVRPEVL